MTGLDSTTDTILSIACFVTNATLDLLEPNGFEAVIQHDKAALDSMNEWCVRTHTASGLVSQCISSTTTAEEASSALLSYIKAHVPDKGCALLAGNSVHADKMFFSKPPWNQILAWLHYRILDVSAIKEAARRWCTPDVLNGVPRKQLKHTAREDILESIEEARYYQGLFTQMRNPAMTDDRTARQTQGNGGAQVGATDEYGNTMQPIVTKEGNGVKRKAVDAGLQVSFDGDKPVVAGLGGFTQSLNGSRVGDADSRRNDAAGFRTDVP
jgi:oligoribonuclease